ncbi:chromatin structure-remodeling complex subunit RSC7 [[Candida] jaroonii]|uniref:Chromatin structure-remodeling complex subunit RSC7 n=1 Tax=[Candida] jaroonii TaxID=467808 RepID=A0ACA9YES2_9ASCO|nr:chromatin structure-remodeling complex subunit RSC7 [[Candida] jaroonii]
MPPRSRTRNASPVPAQNDTDSPPRRSRAARRTDLSGLDIDPEADDDVEYEGEGEVEEGDDLEETPKKRKIGVIEDEEDEEEPEVTGQPGDEGEGPEEEEEEEEIQTAGGETIKVKKEGPKKRGRKKTKLTMTEDGGYYDEDGNLLKIENDEVVVDDEDPKASEKIDEFGNLKGDRKFRNKIFTVLGQGDRKYMVSTEPARLVGFRDSYLLFKTHQNLFKKVCTNEEKMDLIDRHIIPTSYKGRSVNLVTARSIYREFGAKILINGKKVIDDFWEQKARDNGDVEGEYADPNELYSYNITRNGNGDLPANANSQPTAISGAALFSYETDPTWQYQIALQTREFNNKLFQDRGITFGGVKDVYTGLNFLPLGTQPTKRKVYKIEGRDEDNKSIHLDTRFQNGDIRKKYTGLSTLSKDFVNNIQDEEIKKEVMDQINYEETL